MYFRLLVSFFPQNLSLSYVRPNALSLSRMHAQMRSQVPKFGTKLFNVYWYSVIPMQFGLYP